MCFLMVSFFNLWSEWGQLYFFFRALRHRGRTTRIVFIWLFMSIISINSSKNQIFAQLYFGYHCRHSNYSLNQKSFFESKTVLWIKKPSLNEKLFRSVPRLKIIRWSPSLGGLSQTPITTLRSTESDSLSMSSKDISFLFTWITAYNRRPVMIS